MTRMIRLAAVSAWRLVIATSAGVPALYYFEQISDLRYLTQTSNIAVALHFAYAALHPLFTRGRPEPRRAGVRGAVVMTMVLMALVYNLYMHGPLDPWQVLFAHLVTPLLVVVDWLFVGRNQSRLSWWHPLAWLAFPIAYLAYVLIYGATVVDPPGARYPYGSMLDPASRLFPMVIGGCLVAAIVVGYLMVGTGRLRRRARDDDAGDVGENTRHAASAV